MIIKNKKAYSYDVECLRNCFTCTFVDIETDIETVFEISERKCENTELINFILSLELTGILVGYNNHHYDDIIINYILLQLNTNKYTWREMTESIFKLSNTIIQNKDADSKRLYNKYKYAELIETMDLMTFLFSTQLRTSLKACQITMHYENVQEMVIDWQSPIITSRIPELISYNINDAKSTAELARISEKGIRLREDVINKYGINCLSRDDVAMGVDILEKRYTDLTGKKPERVEYNDPIKMTDLLIDGISFKSKEMSELFERLKKYVFYPNDSKHKAFSEMFVYNGVQFSFGIGGLHSINVSQIVIPKKGEILRDADAQSLYPYMILENDCSPRHLGGAFKQVYQQILDERLIAKHDPNLASENIALKFALNGVSGNMGQPFSWLYDPLKVLRIRINGQLLFLMLIERLTEIGCHVISANTDGVTAIIPEGLEPIYNETCKKWEAFSRLDLEYEDFEKVIYRDVNSYFAVKKGFSDFMDLSSLNIKNHMEDAIKKFVKTVGMFKLSVQLGKGLVMPRIIPKALLYHFLFNQPIEQTIQSEQDFKLFLQSQRPDAKYKIRHGNTLGIQRFNRFYVSQKGSLLVKYEQDPDAFESIITQPVKLANNFKVLPANIQDMDIHYSFYQKQARDLLHKIDSPQLTLFNN